LLTLALGLGLVLGRLHRLALGVLARLAPGLFPAPALALVVLRVTTLAFPWGVPPGARFCPFVPLGGPPLAPPGRGTRLVALGVLGLAALRVAGLVALIILGLTALIRVTRLIALVVLGLPPLVGIAGLVPLRLLAPVLTLVVSGVARLVVPGTLGVLG